MEKIKVVIADDHALLRAGLKEVLSGDRSLAIVAECSNGVDAVNTIVSLQPDIAILDVDMPGKSGFEVAQEVRRARVPTRLIALTMHQEASFFNRAMDVGFLGYVVKEGTVADIQEAVKTVYSGRHYVSATLASLVLGRSQSTLPELTQVALLTQSEKRVLKLISENKSTKEIAEFLFISHRTVDTHRANIATKMGIKGAHALLRFALEHKHLL